jgi:uncharacterized cupin superfamily protein
MKITKHPEAIAYDAPFHSGVDTKRLQGMEIGSTGAFWLGLSVYPPGSSAGPSDIVGESIYFVVSGEFVLRCNGITETLQQYDSVHFVKGDHRELVNESDSDAVLAVAIANPPKAD